VVCELFWGLLGTSEGRGGLRGIGVSGSGYNEFLSLGALNVVTSDELRRRAERLASA